MNQGFAALLFVVGCAPAPAELGPPTPDPKPVDTGEPPIDPPVVADDVAQGVSVQVNASPVCRDAGARSGQRYTRIPLDRRDPADHPDEFTSPFGGAGVADLDGDGRVEVILPHGRSIVRVHNVLGDTVVDRTAELLPTHRYNHTAGVLPADYDGDGRLDLLLARAGAPTVLLRNTAAGMVEVTAEAGFPLGSPRSHSGAWADIDGDGDLDLFQTVYGPAFPGVEPSTFGPGGLNRLMLNQGDGTFVDVSDQLPEGAQRGYTLAATFVDLNGDHAPELYVVNDFGLLWGGNQLLWNDGHGRFTADDGSRGLHISVEGMGVDIADLNHDGVPDFVVPGWGEIAALTSLNGRWVDIARAAGLVPDAQRDQLVAWGGMLADLDNDGDDEVLVNFGRVPDTGSFTAPYNQPDAVYRNRGDLNFYDVAPDWGLDERQNSRGVLAVDLNGDGWLDLVKQYNNDFPAIFLAHCAEGAWLSIALEQPGPNPFAIGAKVEVLHGDRRWTRWVRAGGVSFASGMPPEVHVGLGARDRVAQVRVTWPDGEVATVDSVPTRRMLRLVRAP